LGRSARIAVMAAATAPAVMTAPDSAPTRPRSRASRPWGRRRGRLRGLFPRRPADRRVDGVTALITR
jgi:hypothetical protein